jgi:thiosulfate/3-mercaptopyruvate sulfurtransferase
MNALADTQSLHEGTLDAGTLLSLSAGTRIALLEIQAHRRPADVTDTVAPGAIPVYWKDLLWREDIRDFADAALLRTRLAQLGIAADTLIVVYGEHRQYAFYARWVLRHAGLGPVFVLERPETLGQALAPGASGAHELDIAAAPPARRALRPDVLAAVANPDVQVVDARSREEYDGWRVSPAGSEDHGAERAGHIPGALNLHYKDLLDEQGALKSESELRAIVAAAGLRPERPVIAYCRLSHRASLVTFVLQERLGFRDVRLYDGSWTEWGSAVGVPIAHNRPPA